MKKIKIQEETKMKKMVTMFFASCLFVMIFAMTAVAAEASQYAWKETASNNWQVWDAKNNTFVQNAIVKDVTAAGPNVTIPAYYIVVNGQMVAINGNYFGTSVTINQAHDGAYGKVLTGADEVVAENPEKVIDMAAKYDDGVTVGAAPSETSAADVSAGPGVVATEPTETQAESSEAATEPTEAETSAAADTSAGPGTVVAPINVITREEAMALEWPQYDFGTSIHQDATWYSIICNGTYYGDYVHLWYDEGKTELWVRVATPPETPFYKLSNPTVQDVLDALAKLH